MKLALFQIDAFTNKTFGGNPACVVPMQSWLPDATLLNIAKENAVAETAFFIDQGDTIQLRWFTPEFEMDLCGHGTLATAHCLKTLLAYPKDEIIFATASGNLSVRVDNNFYHLDFPARMPLPAQLPEVLRNSLNLAPREVHKSRDYVLVYDTEEQLNNLAVNRQLFDTINLDPGGVCVTAVGNDCDFVSRFFTPQASILEDPVTGSAHCSLIPFWAERLQKKKLSARQISARVGVLDGEHCGDRVIISGQAKTYLAGHIWV